MPRASRCPGGARASAWNRMPSRTARVPRRGSGVEEAQPLRHRLHVVGGGGAAHRKVLAERAYERRLLGRRKVVEDAAARCAVPLFGFSFGASSAVGVFQQWPLLLRVAPHMCHTSSCSFSTQHGFVRPLRVVLGARPNPDAFFSARSARASAAPPRASAVIGGGSAVSSALRAYSSAAPDGGKGAEVLGDVARDVHPVRAVRARVRVDRPTCRRLTPLYPVSVLALRASDPQPVAAGASAAVSSTSARSAHLGAEVARPRAPPPPRQRYRGTSPCRAASRAVQPAACSCATRLSARIPRVGQTWRYPSPSPPSGAPAPPPPPRRPSAAVMSPGSPPAGDGFGHVFAWCVSIRWL